MLTLTEVMVEILWLMFIENANGGHGGASYWEMEAKSFAKLPVLKMGLLQPCLVRWRRC